MTAPTAPQPMVNVQIFCLTIRSKSSRQPCGNKFVSLDDCLLVDEVEYDVCCVSVFIALRSFALLEMC